MNELKELNFNIEKTKDGENNWTEEICQLLKNSGEIDLNKYDIECLVELPYYVSINEYELEKSIDRNNKFSKPVYSKTKKYETDLIISEKKDGKIIPRLIIESKYKGITTHDAITYSNKAQNHKYLHQDLRYGIMIGNTNNIIPLRLFQHGKDFDFMICFADKVPSQKEWKCFIEIIKNNLNCSDEIKKIINREEKPFAIERKVIFHNEKK